MRSQRAADNSAREFGDTDEYRVILEGKRLKFLDETVGEFRGSKGLENLEIQDAAASFRYNYGQLKIGLLWGDPADKDLIHLVHITSIEAFAHTAKNEYERLTSLLEHEMPESGDFRVINENANRWRMISTIVRAASGIRD